MVMIIPKQPGFLEKLGSGLGAGISSGLGSVSDYLMKINLEKYKQQHKKKEEDLGKFESGLETIQRMREIADKGNIGRGSEITGFFSPMFGGETAQDIAEYRQLGTSLIPLVAAGVPVRNQREFDTYRKTITDPHASLAEIKGALNGLENIFQRKIEGVEEEEEKEKPMHKKALKTKRPLSSFG